MGTYLVTLELDGRLASGPGNGAGSALVHSDTLAAALRAVSEEVGEARELFERSPPPFTVSSVFPEVEGVRLYPRPLPPPAAWVEGGAEGPVGAWESIRFLSEARLESLCAGRRVRADREDVVEGMVWGMPSERGLRALPRRNPDRRILVDRAGGPPLAHVRERIEAPPGSRAFFLARLEAPALLAPLRRLLERLGEAGLGGQRSLGAGQFRVAGAHPAPAFLDSPAGAMPDSPAEKGGGAARALLLSLCLPAREEVERGALEGAAAAFLIRGGWIHSGGPTRFRKVPLRLLAEGSLLAAAGAEVRGEVREVTPPGFDRHPVLRDGRAFSIAYRGA